MRKIVHMYLAKGTADEGNQNGYAPGEKHSMLIILATFTDNYDWKEAERVANENGWINLEFTKAGKITTENIAGQDQATRESFASAINDGSSMLVYSMKED